MLTRILAACVGLPLLLAVVLFLPPVATAILFALACGVAAYEMLWRTGILKHRRILVYTVVAAMANVMWSWLRACSIVSEQTLWLCALLGLFVYFCALFCELLAAHTELRFAAVCVALFSGFVYPFLIGALSRNPVVDKYWDSFAVGAALCGIPLVIGENVGGGDNKTEFNPDGSIRALPDLDRRIAVYRRYYNGKGALFVQLNANDAYNGVADYVARKYGDFVCVEIKWGQGAKPINGEGLIRDLDYARFMKSRSYCLRPDPEDPAVQEAFRAGRVKHFTRYTGLTYPALSTPEEVLAEVAAKAEQLRANGAARLALKTGAFGMPDLALAIRVASELDFELLTIDGSGGGTGMSPNDMLDNWGVPSVLLHAKAHDYAFLRAAAGKKVVDLAMGGGLAKPSQAFKALALGAPYVKAVCMSRSFMIPAFLGCNIEGALHPERRERVHGAWSALPKTVLDIGDTPETIFAGYHALKERLGADEMAHIPYGAIAMWTMCDRLGAGLQHHMAGARKFGVEHIDRTDICAANRETAQETGIPFITEQDDELARRIVLG